MNFRFLLLGSLCAVSRKRVPHRRVSAHCFTCCHTEVEVADGKHHLTQSQCVDSWPACPNTGPIRVHHNRVSIICVNIKILHETDRNRAVSMWAIAFKFLYWHWDLTSRVVQEWDIAVYCTTNLFIQTLDLRALRVRRCGVLHNKPVHFNAGPESAKSEILWCTARACILRHWTWEC